MRILEWLTQVGVLGITTDMTILEWSTADVDPRMVIIDKDLWMVSTTEALRVVNTEDPLVVIINGDHRLAQKRIVR